MSTQLPREKAAWNWNGEESLWNLLRWPLRAAVVLVGHLAVALLVLTGIWLTERYMQALYGDRGHSLFGVCPLGWLFDFMDLCILLLFIVWGLVEANNELRGH